MPGTNLPVSAGQYIAGIQEELYLRLDTRGGSMSGNLDMSGLDILNPGRLIGQGFSTECKKIVTNSGTGTPGNLATFLSSTVIQDSGRNISSVPTSASIAATYLPLVGGSMTGAINSTAALDLGTSLSSSVNIGRSSINTTVAGNFVTALPKAAWYSLAGATPSFSAGVFRAIPLVVDNSKGLVDFTINNTNGNLTYVGTVTRTFLYSCNLNIRFTTPSTLTLTLNKNTVTGLVNNTSSQIWDVSIVGSRRLPFILTDQIVLNPGDTIILVGQWGNTSASQVTFGRCSFHISALPN